MTQDEMDRANQQKELQEMVLDTMRLMSQQTYARISRHLTAAVLQRQLKAIAAAADNSPGPGK